MVGEILKKSRNRQQQPMNLILKPLENTSDPVWSVIWMIIILVTGATYYIYKILRLAFAEINQNGSDDPTESEELLQLQSNGD